MTTHEEAAVSLPIREIRPLADGCLATLGGDIDSDNAPELRQALMDLIAAKKPARLILDLRQVPYMDSSGLSVVMELMQQVHSWHGKLILMGVQKRVRNVIEIARLNTVLPIVESESAAIRL